MKKNLNIYRDKNGIPHVEAENQVDLYWGMGFVHATDRGMQLLLMRMLGQGRLSEFLDSSDSSLEIDTFFRKMNWNHSSQDYFDSSGDLEQQVLDAYCDGVNTAFAKKIPWEFKLLGYKADPWIRDDVILISRMISYLTLSQSQHEMERLFVEFVKNGVTEEMLHELFPGILGEMDIGLIKKVRLTDTLIPSSLLWNIAVPRMMASNNWVISGEKTASKKSILANDPHLEVNRLPNIWYEIVGKIKERYIIGATIPGASAFVIGRSPELAWGATYAFADSVDSWIEDCREGKYRRGDTWKEFKVRKEIIKRKKKEDVEVTFYENDHGVLEGNPYDGGYYLATRWAGGESGVVSVKNFLKIWDAKNVEEGMDYLGQIEGYWSWVLADMDGNIGFQMSGLIPKRREGVRGFVPLPGWDEKNDWLGFENHRDLPRVFNPSGEFFTTANQDLNEYGRVKPITMPMGSYRAERISSILEKGKNFTPSDMFKMHFDVYSIQAERFMEILKPLLPDSKQGEILKSWNYEYDADSKGAFLFEVLYHGLYKEVFGKNGVGEGVIEYLDSETGLFIDFYQNFDKILLAEKSAWFNGKTREELYENVVRKYLDIEPQHWAENRKILFKNILFDGKLPRFLGFDKGPIPLIGGRATIHQGQIYRSADRMTTFSPSFRTVTDFAKEETYTNMAGGPCDRRFSKWYTSDLQNWLNGSYKTVRVDPVDKSKF